MLMPILAVVTVEDFEDLLKVGLEVERNCRHTKERFTLKTLFT